MSFYVNEGLGTEVEFPRIPEEIRYRKQADIKDLRYPSSRPIIIVYGGKADRLTISGRLNKSGQTKAQIITNYITPLQSLLYTEVTVDYVNRPYDGETFVFLDFEWEERPGWARTIYYRAEFVKGDIHIVL